MEAAFLPFPASTSPTTLPVLQCPRKERKRQQAEAAANDRGRKGLEELAFESRCWPKGSLCRVTDEDAAEEREGCLADAEANNPKNPYAEDEPWDICYCPEFIHRHEPPPPQTEVEKLCEIGWETHTPKDEPMRMGPIWVLNQQREIAECFGDLEVRDMGELWDNVMRRMFLWQFEKKWYMSDYQVTEWVYVADDWEGVVRTLMGKLERWEIEEHCRGVPLCTMPGRAGRVIEDET